MYARFVMFFFPIPQKVTLFPPIFRGYHLESIGQNIRNLLSGFQEAKDSL